MTREKRGKTLFRVRLITSGFGNSAGDTLLVKEVDAKGNIYYYDGFGRWCYLRADEEGKYWERIKTNAKQTKN